MRASIRLACVLLGLCLVAAATVQPKKSDPVIPGWGTVTDPDGDCTVAEENGKLVIKIPATFHNLNPERAMNAPRVLREVAGDFMATVKVTGDFSPGKKVTKGTRTPGNYAGLLLWADEGNYVRLERNARWDPSGELVCYPPGFEYYRRGKYQDTNPDSKSADFFKGRSTYLRLERKGDKVTASYSHDGKDWREVKEIPVELPRKVWIGVAAVNSSDAPFVVEFEGLQVMQPLRAVSMAPGSIRSVRIEGGKVEITKDAIRIEGGKVEIIPRSE